MKKKYRNVRVECPECGVDAFIPADELKKQDDGTTIFFWCDECQEDVACVDSASVRERVAMVMKSQEAQ